jgi:hypothetical protein
MLPLRLPPHGSVFVVFRRPSPDFRIVSVNRDGRTLFPGRAGTVEELPALDVLLQGNDTLELRAWKPGTYRLRTNRGQDLPVSVDAVPDPREIRGPWQLTFPEGSGAPESTSFERLISWPEHSEPGVKYFSGTATYHKRFDVPATLLENNQLVLDLGEVQNLAEVTLNGNDLGVLWTRPFRVDVSDALRAGKNDLLVKVTNLWPNRLIGDQFLPPEKRIARTNAQHFKKDSPLTRSGLLGPVRIRAAARKKVTSSP